MTVIVTDRGFGTDSHAGDWHEMAPDADPQALAGQVHDLAAIRIAFPGYGDGRGFTLAARLRRMGFAGRLRAAGHVIADQYAMARRAGFDEVEIPAELAARQPEAQWIDRAAWQSHDYRARFRKATA